MRSLTSIASVLGASVLLVGLGACVSNPQRQAQPVPYPTNNPQPVQRVEMGRVTQMELVRSEEKPRTSGAGAVLGGVAGAILGRQIGGGTGRDVATVLGAVGGAVLGNSIEGQQSGGETREAYRVTVQANDGSLRYFEVPTQANLRIGDWVRMENGQLFRN